MDGASAVGSIFNASWRIATVIYELKAVGEQTRDLLDTTSQVSSTLQHAQVLRRQRSGLLNGTEKKWIDDVLVASERAVGNVAELIEPARVDMQTRYNKIRLLTRTQFILRDSPKVQVQLGRLGIAAQGLNMAMGVLCAREGSIPSIVTPIDGGSLRQVDSGTSESDVKPPPSYEVVELLDRRRESVLKRRASKLPLAPVNLDAESNKAMTLEEDPNSLPMVNINVAEVQPTPMTSPQPDRYAESDGLQVVENHSFWSSNPWNSSAPDLPSRGPSPMEPYSRETPISADQYSRSRSPSFRTPDYSTPIHIPDRPAAPPPEQQPRGPPRPEQECWPEVSTYHYPPPQTSTSTSTATATSNAQYYNRPLPPDPPPPRPPYFSSTSQPQPSTASLYNLNPNPNYNQNYNPNPHQNQNHSYTYPPPHHHPISTSTSTLSPYTNTNPTYCLSPSTTTTTTSLSPDLYSSQFQSHSHSHSNSNTQSQSRSLSRPASFSSIRTTEELSLSSLSSSARQKGRARGRAWLEHHTAT